MGELRNLAFAKKDRAFRWKDLGKKHLEERRLTGARVADDGNKFAVADKHYQTFKAQTYGGEPTELDYAFQRGAGIRNVLGEQAKLARLIVKNPDIDAEQKRQMIDQIYLSMIQIAKGGLEELNTINQAMEEPFK